MPNGAYNISKIAPCINAANTERVILIQMSDSNNGRGGATANLTGGATLTGWRIAIVKALYNAGWNIWGHEPTPFSPSANFPDSGAPDPYGAFGQLASGAGRITGSDLDYVYRSDTTASPSPYNFFNLPTVFFDDTNTGVPLSGNVTLHAAYGIGMGGTTGNFTPSARGENPYSDFIVGDSFSGSQSGDGMADAQLSMAAATRKGLQFNLGTNDTGGVLVGQGITGPFFATLGFAELADVSSGFMLYSMVSYGGGASGQFLNNTLADASANAHAQEIASLLQWHGDPGNAKILVCINAGMNDNGQLVSAADYKANIEAIMAKVLFYVSNTGANTDNVYFFLYPSHVVSDPDAALLSAYRTAAKQLSDENEQTAAWSFEDAGMTAAEATANGWYDSGGNAHLTMAGYDHFAPMIVNDLVAPAAGGAAALNLGLGIQP